MIGRLGWVLLVSLCATCISVSPFHDPPSDDLDDSTFDAKRTLVHEKTVLEKELDKQRAAKKHLLSRLKKSERDHKLASSSRNKMDALQALEQTRNYIAQHHTLKTEIKHEQAHEAKENAHKKAKKAADKAIAKTREFVQSHALGYDADKELQEKRKAEQHALARHRIREAEKAHKLVSLPMSKLMKRSFLNGFNSDTSHHRGHGPGKKRTRIQQDIVDLARPLKRAHGHSNSHTSKAGNVDADTYEKGDSKSHKQLQGWNGKLSNWHEKQTEHKSLFDRGMKRNKLRTHNGADGFPSKPTSDPVMDARQASKELLRARHSLDDLDAKSSRHSSDTKSHLPESKDLSTAANTQESEESDDVQPAGWVKDRGHSPRHESFQHHSKAEPIVYTKEAGSRRRRHWHSRSRSRKHRKDQLDQKHQRYDEDTSNGRYDDSSRRRKHVKDQPDEEIKRHDDKDDSGHLEDQSDEESDGSSDDDDSTDQPDKESSRDSDDGGEHSRNHLEDRSDEQGSRDSGHDNDVNDLQTHSHRHHEHRHQHHSRRRYSSTVNSLYADKLPRHNDNADAAKFDDDKSTKPKQPRKHKMAQHRTHRKAAVPAQTSKKQKQAHPHHESPKPAASIQETPTKAGTKVVSFTLLVVLVLAGLCLCAIAIVLFYTCKESKIYNSEHRGKGHWTAGSGAGDL